MEGKRNRAIETGEYYWNNDYCGKWSGVCALKEGFCFPMRVISKNWDEAWQYHIMPSKPHPNQLVLEWGFAKFWLLRGSPMTMRSHSLRFFHDQSDLNRMTLEGSVTTWKVYRIMTSKNNNKDDDRNDNCWSKRDHIFAYRKVGFFTSSTKCHRFTLPRAFESSTTLFSTLLSPF